MVRAVFGLTILICAQSAMAQSDISSDDIKAIQQQLAEDGYDVDDVDGQLGNKTAAAVRMYQSDWKLRATGEISHELLDRILNKHPATQPQWAKIENGDCVLWNDNPQAQETVSWSGGCISGRTSGFGTAQWRFVLAGVIRESRHEGDYRDGRSNGHGVHTDANGDLYEGEWRDGALNGHGVLTMANGNRYDGEWRGGKRNGRGVLTLADGGRYEGEWRDGERNGSGVQTTAAGATYDGEWRDGKQDGRGVITFADGGRYDGEWREGIRHGRGVLSFPGGNRFEGEWREGSITGHGVLIHPNGARFEGEYHKGERNGYGVRIYADGDRFEGEFRDDTPNGRGTLTSGGVAYSGIWKNGCLRTRGQDLAVDTTMEACGF